MIATTALVPVVLVVVVVVVVVVDVSLVSACRPNNADAGLCLRFCRITSVPNNMIVCCSRLPEVGSFLSVPGWWCCCSHFQPHTRTQSLALDSFSLTGGSATDVGCTDVVVRCCMFCFVHQTLQRTQQSHVPFAGSTAGVCLVIRQLDSCPEVRSLHCRLQRQQQQQGSSD